MALARGLYLSYSYISEGFSRIDVGHDARRLRGAIFRAWVIRAGTVHAENMLG